MLRQVTHTARLTAVRREKSDFHLQYIHLVQYRHSMIYTAVMFWKVWQKPNFGQVRFGYLYGQIHIYVQEVHFKSEIQSTETLLAEA
jgi:hypothetical protein